MGRKPINRTGEVGYNNQGLKMTIVEYRNNADIDVQFEDGNVIKNKEYRNFKNGLIKNPNYKDVNMIDRKGEVNYNNQGLKMTIITYRGCEDIDIQFEDGTIVYNKNYDNFKKGSIKYPIVYNNSVVYYIIEELGLNLDDIWNWEKNNKNGINPYELYKYSNKKIWVYCQEHDYHNYDREGNKIGYITSCRDFAKNKKCSYCSSKKIHYKNSIAYNYPKIAKMIAIEENNLTFEDCYSIACNSNKQFYIKCSVCKEISDKKYRLCQIVKSGYSCRYCSDGISIPNKFMANILKQLNIDFKTEFSSKKFSSKNYFRYDFYLPKYNMIIEANGIQHYEECALTKRTLKEEQMNDLFKYKCAKDYINEYITIDCRYSTLEWMKENIIKELGEYFDLSNINWELAWEESQNSLCVEAWNLWNSGICNINKISDILNLSYSTVYNYIRNGKKYKKII